MGKKKSAPHHPVVAVPVPDNPVVSAETDGVPMPLLGEEQREWLYPPVLESGIRRPVRFGGATPLLSASATAWYAWNVWRHQGGWLLLVCDGPRTQEKVWEHLSTLRPAGHPTLSAYPGWEHMPGQGSINMDVLGDRLACLHQLRMTPEAGGVVVTSIQALMQKTLSGTSLGATRRALHVGNSVSFDELLNDLETLGYCFSPEVLNKGEVSRRGGLIDLWPPHLSRPHRVEFFGDEIESIRAFEPDTQRSLASCTILEIVPATDPFCAPQTEGTPSSESGSFFDHLPEHTTWMWLDSAAIVRHADMYYDTLCEAGSAPSVLPPSETLTRMRRSKIGSEFWIGPCALDDEAMLVDAPGLDPIHGVPVLAGIEAQPELIEEERRRFVGELLLRADAGARVIVLFSTPGAMTRFDEILQAFPRPSPSHFFCALGVLEEGFQTPDQRCLLVSETELYGIRKKQRGKYETKRRDISDVETGTRYHDFSEMLEGELVVHVQHGIGRYLGLRDVEFDGRRQEVISLEYADGGRLHLPVSQAHLLSRYVGLGASSPKLHTLGGKRWAKEKDAAEEAVEDLAANLLQTQANRRILTGHAFPPDTVWQQEFEATFPFQETEDQLSAIAAVKRDMESTLPMDRLICGDVGYGKTEVAMRAAFKAVMDGRQVAVLVPTTILAQQHTHSFRERMAAFPVTIEVISRFRTRAEQHEVLDRTRAGGVDILIGTHRILQQDVRFHNLGLVIIDEEQRFGVKHKERLKRLRTLVDVLTLSATPIPRTLYMSLTGARDMSTIQTAPRERHPILTYVRAYDEEIIRTAVLRELNREGQVFFLHNRVQTIRVMEKTLQRLVPEARILVGHGQMPENALEDTMHRFIDGEADILLCTTIIESGVDIPNVNTIIIDRADRFGLSELYQLRGRVGRYKNQAYAYLLTPPGGGMTHDARRRMSAIQRYSSLGAGFKLALRDLEIRGAGNLLGAQQSGHITSVGFDLYCRLLDQTVARLNNQPVQVDVESQVLLDFIHFDAEREDSNACLLPRRYLDDESLRVQMYRAISGARFPHDIERIAQELHDRFGRPPTPVRNLLQVARIRIAASFAGLRSVEVRAEKVLLTKGTTLLSQNGRLPRISTKLDTPNRLHALLELVTSYAPQASA